MELHPLDPPDLPRPGTVDAGWARAISHGPMTVEQVLGRGLAAMLDEDERERRAADPVAWIRAHRRTRTLWGRLFGRR